MDKLFDKVYEALDKGVPVKEIINNSDIVIEAAVKLHPDLNYTIGVYRGHNLNDSKRLQNEKYFKFIPSKHSKKSKILRRISMIEPRFIIHNKDSNTEWKMSGKDIDILIDILNSDSINYDGYTKWQELVMLFNLEAFGIPIKVTQTDLTIGTEKGKYPTALSINHPIPDYTKLKKGN